MRLATFVLALAAAGPALAHPGEHGHMSLLEIVGHFAEPDHLALLALTVVVGVLAYHLGRRVEARAARRAAGRSRRP